MSPSNPVISVLNWRLIGPFQDTAGNAFVDSGLSYEKTFSALKARFRYLKDTIVRQEKGSFLNLQNIFSAHHNVSCYATCNLISESDKDVAFIMGMDDNFRLWVNNKLVAFNKGTRRLVKDQVIKKVPLKQGVNKILVEVSVQEQEPGWKFCLDLATIAHVKENALIHDYFNTTLHSLLAEGDTLSLRLSAREFIPIDKPFKFDVFDVSGNLIKSDSINISKNSKVPLNDFRTGIYRYTLKQGLDSLDGFFSYGSMEQLYYNKLKSGYFNRDSVLYKYLEPYINRLNHLVTLYKGIEVSLEMRIVACLYKINELDEAFRNHDGNFGSKRGMQLRSFVSSVDRGKEFYQLYIPNRLRKDTLARIPLVVMVPHVISKHPFVVGGTVSNTRRSRYIAEFAERYGLAVLWPGARVYIRYNHTRIVTRSILDNLADVAKYYPIDTRQVYLYGDCSGGMQALLTAIRRPDLVAGIALEGPELSTVNFSGTKKDTTPAFLENDIFKYADNLSSIPLFILHSRNDRKAELDLSIKLMSKIRSHGGVVYYDDLRDAAKQGNNDEDNETMISEPEVMNKIFNFFSHCIKKGQTAKEWKMSFTTSARFPDTAYGIRILNKENGGDASYQIHLKSDGGYEIQTRNIRSFSLNPETFVHGNKIKVINLNGRETGIKGRYDINMRGAEAAYHGQKSHIPVGPINKIFSSTFAVIRPDHSNAKDSMIIRIIDSIWNDEYYSNVQIIGEAQKGGYLSKGYSLIQIINTPDEIAQSILKAGGLLSQTGNLLNNQVSYAIIAEQAPFSGNNLIIGTTAASISKNMLLSIIEGGWNNIEVWNGRRRIYSN